MRDILSKPDSDAIFERNFKDAFFPLLAPRAVPLEGTVLFVTPPDRPSRIVFAMTDGKTPDVIINVRSDIRIDTKVIKAGVAIQFWGVIRSMQREPFVLTFSLESPRDIGINLFHQ